jgi:hypothetical protein
MILQADIGVDEAPLSQLFELVFQSEGELLVEVALSDLLVTVNAGEAGELVD